MSTTIDPALPPGPKWPTGEGPAASMRAMASASGAQLDLTEVMRLYSEAGTASMPRSEGTGATRPGVPVISTPTLSVDDAVLMIGMLQSKLMDLMAQQQTGEVKSNQIDMKAKNAEQLKKVQDWLQQVTEAANQRKNVGIWGWIKRAFTIIASVVGVVLALAAVPATGGASAIAAWAMFGVAAWGTAGSLVNLGVDIAVANGANISDGWKNALGHMFSVGGLVSWAAQGMGASETATAWIGIGVDLLVGLGSGIGMFVIGRKLGGVAAEAGAEALETTAAKTLSAKFAISTSAKEVSVGVDVSSNIYASVSGVGEGMATLGAADAQKSADESTADKMAIMAEIERIRMVMEQNVDDLKKIAEQSQNIVTVIGDLIRGEADMKEQINAHLGGRGAPV